jgi:hypothetical protein
VSAAIATSVLALAGVLATVAANQFLARQDRLRKDFAEALAAVERYAELPYRILRRQASDAETRERLSEAIHEVQQDLLFHRSWVRVQDARVADAYDALVGAARREAGQAMTQAWSTDPIASDEGMPLGVGLTFPEMERRREEYIEAVRWQLQWLPARWVKAHVIPWILELPRRSKDGG